MAVWGKNRHYHINGIQRRHFNHMAPRCGLGKDAEAIIERLIAQTPRVLATVNAELPRGFPVQIAEPILGQLEKAAQRLSAMPTCPPGRQPGQYVWLAEQARKAQSTIVGG